MTLDFACAWGNAFLTLLTLNEIEHAALAIGQHVARMARFMAKASSNEQWCIEGLKRGVHETHGPHQREESGLDMDAINGIDFLNPVQSC
jgi:hypothetical protein